MQIVKLDIANKKYPQRLLKLKNFPTEIFVIGNIELLNTTHTVGIVGARKCSDYGGKVANEFAKKIAEKNICVVSGMAIGIDGISHNAAIDEKGKTIAVLGGGFNYIYPPENEWLFYKIIEKGGCIISEYSPETKPDSKKIPNRNRIISGLSDSVLVIEAMYRSGSTITAKYAKNEGKTVYAIPNNIYASTGIGTNKLIQNGAILVTEPMQIIKDIKGKKCILEDMDEGKTSGKSDNEKNFSEAKMNTIKQNDNSKIKIESINQIMTKEELEIYKVLSEEPIHINELAKRLNKQVYEVSPSITMMEISGYIEQPQTNYFRRIVIDVEGEK